MPTVVTHKAPFEVDILTIDGKICLSPADISQLTGLQLLTILRWWQGCGEERYQRDHEIHNLGYDPSKPRPGAVYLLRRSDGQTKIGYTSIPTDRYQELRREHGPLELLAELWSDSPRKLERQIHLEFDDYRISGEWFDLPEQEIEMILKVQGVLDE
jgi:hypothetical protein